MKRLKICVYAICKNEEKFVDGWMDSMSEADLIVVTDTGSTDGTVEKLKERRAVVYTDIIDPWRFDVARNTSIEHIPEDVDVCVSTDLDERFQKGWRKCIENAWFEGATMGSFLYNWSLHPDGTPDVQFHYYKVHARHDHKWVCPVHEHLRYVGKNENKTVFIPGMVLNHYPDPAKSRSSYLSLLELGVKENPDNDRMAYYLGREYLHLGKWEQCTEMMGRYLKLPTATWREERCAAMRGMANSYYQLKNLPLAYAWYYRAVAEMPAMREPYVEFARMAYELSDWSTAFYMANEALKILDKSPYYINIGYAWDHTPDDYCAIACYRLGIYALALEHAQKAADISPGDARLKENIKSIEAKISEKKE